jgi:hypothetical protein
MSDLEPDRVFCARCKEDFPLAPKGMHIRLGYNYPISKLPLRIRRKVQDSHRGFKYLCGNCYFDLLDEMDEGI